MQTDCFPETPFDKGPISSLASINPNYRMSKGKEYPFLEMAAVSENFRGISGFEVRQLEGTGLSRYASGDVLFAKITPCPQNGKIAHVLNLPFGGLGLGSTEFIVLSPNTATDPRYLYHLACSSDFRMRACVRMEGSTGRQRVPSDVFENRLIVPIPPRVEQEAIARILDGVDTAVAKLETAVERAEDLTIALTQELLAKGVGRKSQRKTQIGLLPESWDVLPVSDVTTSLEYGLSLPMQAEGEIPILRMGNLQSGRVLFNDLKYVTLSPTVRQRYLLRRGDVLFNRVNSQDLVGKVGIYREARPCVFASYLIRVHVNPDLIDNWFLGHVLNSYQAQCRIKRYATPGVQQVNINASNLGRVLIPVPRGPDGLREQREIASALELSLSAIDQRRQILERLADLKRSLSHGLLSGRIHVPTEVTV